MTVTESKPSDFLPHVFGEGLPDFEGSSYFNARWYDADTGRFITEDPVRDGLLWYAYANNNPMKFTDPTGMRLSDPTEGLDEHDLGVDTNPSADDSGSGSSSNNDEEISEEEKIYNQNQPRENGLEELLNYDRFGPDPDSLNYNDFGLDPNQLDKIQEEVDAHLGSAGGLYGNKNMCDDWAKDRLDNAGVDTSDLFAGDPNGTKVAQDIENAQEKGLGSSLPKEGWSLVFMGKSKAGLDEHAGLLKMNSDGSGTFYDSSSTNANQLPEGHNFDNFEDKFSKRGGDKYGHYETQIFIPVKP